MHYLELLMRVIEIGDSELELCTLEAAQTP